MKSALKVLPLAVCVALTAAGAPRAAQARSGGGHDAQRRAFLDRVQARDRALLPVVVVPPAGIEPPPSEAQPTVTPTARHVVERAERVAELSEQLAEHLDARLLHGRVERRRLAGQVRRAPLGDETLSLAATVRLPLSLPSHTREFNRATGRERFAVATLTVRCSHGDALAEATGELNGREVKLGSFARQRRFFPAGVTYLLEIYAEKAVDRAFARLDWNNLAARARRCPPQNTPRNTPQNTSQENR